MEDGTLMMTLLACSGHIARETARMAQALGMRVTCATRTGHATKIGGYLLPQTGDPDGQIPEKWYTTTSSDSLAEFYATADVVVNSLPSTEETKGFVAEQAFRDMRDDAVFVNIGRGDTVDQEIMTQALEAGLQSSSLSDDKSATTKPNGNLRISAASLDVTSPEPLPPTNKLWRLPNVLLTPHMSGGSELYWYRVTDLASINVRRVLKDGLGGLNAVRGKGEE
jgi:phosphoglycerate dehydrogenase-like enzyme